MAREFTRAGEVVGVGRAIGHHGVTCAANCRSVSARGLGAVRSRPDRGHRCRVPLSEVNVLQVIEAVDGATDIGRCVVADRPCRAADPCVLHEAGALARNELVVALQSAPKSGVSTEKE